MSALLRKCFDDWQCCASSATGPSTEAELIRQKTGQNLVALTSTFSVELPGIEPAPKMAVSWGNVDIGYAKRRQMAQNDLRIRRGC